jgi:hypothetical protein
MRCAGLWFWNMIEDMRGVSEGGLVCLLLFGGNRLIDLCFCCKQGY